MNKKLLALLLAGTFVFAGCGADNNKEDKSQKAEVSEDANKNNNETKETENKDQETASNVEVVLPETKVTLKAASYKFESLVGGLPYNLTEVKFEKEDGKDYYKFEGNKNSEKYSLAVDANSAETKKGESKKADDKENPVDLGKAIPPEEAMRIAIESNKGGTVKAWTLSNDGSNEKYEIELEDGTKVIVNAITKAVM